MDVWWDIATYGLGIAFAVHNLEETLGMERWTLSLREWMDPVTTRQFAWASGILTLLGFMVVGSRWWVSSNMYYFIITAFAGMLLLNVFFPHVLATLIFKRLAPGVLTAILINLPLSVFILYRVFLQGWLSVREGAVEVACGTVLGLALAFALLKMAKQLV